MFSLDLMDKIVGVLGMTPAVDLVRTNSRTIMEVRENVEEVLDELAGQGEWVLHYEEAETPDDDNTYQLVPSEHRELFRGLIPLLKVEGHAVVSWWHDPFPHVWVESGKLPDLLEWAKTRNVKISVWSMVSTKADLGVERLRLEQALQRVQDDLDALK